ncbi:MAG TPA: hypothetical protein VL945_00810 [Candidatus Saccharimonadales bacterium]|nr:hypothetical protein [Candidatus Saccharimonadales bacterium]
MGKGTKTLAVVLFVAVVILAAYFLFGTTVKTSSLSIQLTDPPHVPSNTESLNITYSSLQLEVTNSSGSAWVTTYVSGSADLMALVNLSKTIGSADIPLNSTVSKVRLNITSATITINGTSYAVTPASRQLTGDVSGSAGRNSSTLVVDLSPTIVTIFTSNSTVFVMVPSLRGVIVSGAKSTLLSSPGGQINASLKSSLAKTIPSLVITKAAVGASGNQTTVSVTVRDNSSSPITIRNLLLAGNSSARVSIGKAQVNSQPSFDNITSASLLNGTFSVIANALNQISAGGSGSQSVNSIISGINLSQLAGLVSSAGASSGELTGLASKLLLNRSSYNLSSISKNLNSSSSTSLLRNIIGNLTNSSYANSLRGQNLTALEGILQEKLSSGNLSKANLTAIIELIANAQAQAELNRAKTVAIQSESFGTIYLLVGSNGTLSLPSVTAIQSSSYGYTISPGQSATLAFSGTVLLDGGAVTASLVKGNTYKLEVIGDNGVASSINVTAS